ncbi:serine protease inhibitor 77Ba-like [Pieris napi]|uniref:serine protease inhibitor 77Ba-like n=1 Tax=Pieris napi TaxID=78633 RepID=UPI001FB90620|nr:serine protease inhibitor 77Ba-like [Pieris napi]
MELKFLFFVGLIPSILCQCSVENAKPEFRRAVFDFSVDLMMRIAEEKESHFIASTLSTWTLLSCISLGATDKTLAELKDVLHLHSHSCFNNKFLDIVKIINSNSSSDVVVERNSIIFTDENLPIKNYFKNTIISKKVSDFQVLSFGNPEYAASVINNYVSEATHGSINEVVAPGDLDDIVMLAIDAIFFKGTWNVPFGKEDTEVSAFYNEKGDQTGDVNLMFVTGNFYQKEVDVIGAQVLELPYGSDERYTALFFLPYPDVSLFSVIEKLKTITLTTIYKLFESEEKQDVMVQLPRFKTSTNLNNLKELLSDMGLRTMFDSSQASFAKISPYELSVSDFFQKADIEVNEEGTTASAVSGAGFISRSLPEKFTANRPFLYMIIDKEIEVPLFAGAYSKPSVY